MKRNIFRRVSLVTLLLLAVSATKTGAQTPTEPITPPYELNLRDDAERALYTILDNNEDGLTWEGKYYGFYCTTSGSKKADDWLFSPAFTLEGGKTYNIAWTGHNRSSDHVEIIEILAGTERTPAAMTEQVNAAYRFTKVYKEDIKTTFTPSETGTYYFGFHCISAAGSEQAYVDAFTVGEGVSAEAPDVVTNLTATAGENGELTAVIKFTTPTTAIDGSALESLERVVVVNETTGKEVGQVDQPAVGQEYSVTDEAAKNDPNSYAVVCYSDKGIGKTAYTSVFVGIDTPAAVGNPTWTQEGKDVILTWGVPAGANKGYIDPNALTYKIQRATTLGTVTVAENHVGETFVDTGLEDFDGQTYLSYYITPSSSHGTGTGKASFGGPFGTPFDLPFEESFAGGSTHTDPWYSIAHGGASNVYWDIVSGTSDPRLSPQDGDGGMLAIGTGKYVEQSICSPIIAIPETERATLTFYAVQNDYDNSLDVRVSTNAGHSWSRIKMISRTQAQWTKFDVDLTAYAGQNISIAFRALVEDYASQVAVDNITITYEPTTGIEHTTAVTTGDNLQYYNLGGARTNRPEKGIYIVRDANGNAVKVVK